MNSIRFYANEGKSLEYVEEFIMASGFRAQLINWETNPESTDGPLIIYFDLAKVDQIIEIGKKRKNKFLIALNPRFDFKHLSKLAPISDKVFGYIDISNTFEYNTPLLLNYQNSLNPVGLGNMGALEDFMKNLEEISDLALNELEQVRKIHSKSVKIREDVFERMSISSKYRTGEMSGGEIFDIFEYQGDLLFISTSSNDFMFNLNVMQVFEKILHEKSKIVDREYRKNLSVQIENLTNELNCKTSYSIIYFDKNASELEIMASGYQHFIIQDEVLTLDHMTKCKVRGGDKIYLFSNGFNKNMELLNKQFSLKTTFELHKENSEEFLNECFFELTKNKTGKFLKFDAIAFCFEVTQKKLFSIE